MRPAFTAEQALSAQGVAPAEVTPQQSIPLYGNWCGPGQSGPGAPIDDLDTCCMVHDNCYGREGYFDCGCDAALCGCAFNASWGSAGKNAAKVAITGYYCGPHFCNPF